MQKTNFFIGILFCFFVSMLSVQAQNPTSIDVNNLSEQQIQQIVNEVNARGLTMDEAAQMAQFQVRTIHQL